jgi:hypothetical protein
VCCSGDVPMKTYGARWLTNVGMIELVAHEPMTQTQFDALSLAILDQLEREGLSLTNWDGMPKKIKAAIERRHKPTAVEADKNSGEAR